jgi:hypothetical protein
VLVPRHRAWCTERSWCGRPMLQMSALVMGLLVLVKGKAGTFSRLFRSTCTALQHRGPLAI